MSALALAALGGPATGNRLTSRLLRPTARGIAGIVIVGLVLLVALLAPVLAPHDPANTDITRRLRPPAWSGGEAGYPLGTDALGRDLLSRIIFGAQISLTVSLAATLGAVLVGITLGLLSGYYGGWVDETLMRLTEIQLSFPYLLLAITIMAMLQPNVQNVILVLAISGWVIYARLVRGQALRLRQREFVQAARALGARDGRIMARHLLPNLIPTVVVVATLQVAQFIVAEAALSFLGLGLRPPTPSWGGMMNEGREYLANAGWITTFPGLVMIVATAGIGLLGDWLRDVLDPRLKL